jgi:hypothetical protein
MPDVVALRLARDFSSERSTISSKECGKLSTMPQRFPSRSPARLTPGIVRGRLVSQHGSGGLRHCYGVRPRGTPS